MAVTTTSQEAAGVQSALSAPRTAAGRRTLTTGRTIWLPLAVFVLLVGVAYADAAIFNANGLNFVVPFPHQALAAAVNPVSAAIIYPALFNSVLVALTGLAVAVVVGVVWAVVMVQARWVERALFPYAVILQCIPILAIAPLIGIVFNYGFEGRVVVTVLIAVFPMVANTLFGLQAADKGQRELFQLQGASRWTKLVKLQFPAALPSIFVGLRNAAGLSVIGAIVGDQLLGRGAAGLGVAIQVFASRTQGPESWAAILIAALFGVAVFVIFGLLGRLAVGKWFDLG